jgi:hypothetical protein
MSVLSTAAAGAVAIAVLGFATSSQAVAVFKVDPNPDGQKLFLTKAKDATASSGTVGSATVAIAVSGAADFADGFSTIKPDNDMLTALTFTPTNPNAFDSFSFRGQDRVANQTIEVIVQDNQGDAAETFDFTEGKANQDFSREGIFADVTGKTIKTIELINSGGFKEAKQFEFDLAPGVTGGIPEPATWAVMLVGFGGLGVAMRSRRKAASTS